MSKKNLCIWTILLVGLALNSISLAGEATYDFYVPRIVCLEPISGDIQEYPGQGGNWCDNIQVSSGRGWRTSSTDAAYNFARLYMSFDYITLEDILNNENSLDWRQAVSVRYSNDSYTAVFRNTELGIYGKISVLELKHFRVTVWTTGPDQILTEVAESLEELLALATPKAEKKIEKAIGHLYKALDPDLWNEDSTLGENGKKVFKGQEKAAHELMKLTKKGELSEEILAAIEQIVTAAEELAQTAIDQAMAQAEAGGCYEDDVDDKSCDKMIKKIAKAEREVYKAIDEYNKGNYDKAIKHYGKAWKNAQKALGLPVAEDEE